MSDSDEKVKVAIIGDSALTRAIIMNPRAMGMSTMLSDSGMIVENVPAPISLDNFVAKRYLWPEKGALKAETVAAHQVNGRGKLVPIKTTVAVKFPLLSRRQRRAIQREISKAANKQSRT
jgi:hypothetical protein